MSEGPVPLAVPCLGTRAIRYLEDCVVSNYVSSAGPFVGRFEREFASRIGARNAVACSSGTAALHVALRVAGVGPGDDVLVSDFTFIATVNPIVYQGARPVLVDSDEATWNISPALILEELGARARTGKTMPKAVLAAHVLGLPADLEQVREACERFGVVLIEDAAEALGATYEKGLLAGKQVGTVGQLGCFSFNGNKIITTGGGGMVATPDEALAVRAAHLTRQARLPGPEYLHDEIGYNYRLTNLAAGLGLSQLELLDSFLERKREIARRYDDALGAVPGLRLPPRPLWAKPSMWLYSILVDPAEAGIDRKDLFEALARAGIESRPVWAPAHIMPFYRDVPRLGGAVGEVLFARGLSLPCSVGLSESDQRRVIDVALEALQHGKSGAAGSR